MYAKIMEGLSSRPHGPARRLSRNDLILMEKGVRQVEMPRRKHDMQLREARMQGRQADLQWRLPRMPGNNSGPTSKICFSGF